MRTFVAITTPPRGAVPAFLDDCRRRLDVGRPDVKWVAAGHRHVTLRFLGDVPEEDLPVIQEALARGAASRPPFTAFLAGWGAFPSTSRPQTLWVSADAPDGALQALEAAVDGELRALGFPPETKPFHPHITLGRVRTAQGVAALVRALRTPAPACRTGFAVDGITLFESVLTPTGPRYSVLMNAPLGVARKPE